MKNATSLAARAAAPAATMLDASSMFGDGLAAMLQLKIAPDSLATLQTAYVTEATDLWNRLLMPAQDKAAVGTSNATDRRFAAPEWVSDPRSNFLAQMYLLNAKTLTQMAEVLEADEKTKARVKFAVQQFVDAAAPSNYFALNPEAQRKAIESRGESISRGIANLVNDIRQGYISQTDESVFEVGRNLATTQGAVVFENELFQLLEYTPLTPKVHARPILFIPPCINKFYILDLQPENSLIRYTVAQGHRVFLLSWRNADSSMAHMTWDDYIEKGAIEAIRTVQEIAASEKINTLGFCIGGTILATTLAVRAARGERPAASMTLLTTFLDFSDTGVLDVFIDEATVRLREMTVGPDSPSGGGLLKGRELATTFSLLRPNDLVWNYVASSYLKGEPPPPFDLLYWNGDGTNLPGPMYCWYLRNTYLENNLVKPGKVTVAGEKVDLGRIDVPSYVYASRGDHIVPWAGAYRNLKVLKGPTRFVLGAAGHTAGVINPPAARKRSHWIGAEGDSRDSAEWLDKSTEHTGSWWPDWTSWLKPLSGKLVAAPAVPGNRDYKPIEPAPGRYVKAKASP